MASEEWKDKLLGQFRDNLYAMLLEIDATALENNDHDAKIHSEIHTLLKKEPFSWNNAYMAEKLICRILGSAALASVLSRKVEYFDGLRSSAHNHYVGALKELNETKDDPGFLDRQRALVARMLDDLHWYYSQRQMNRERLVKFDSWKIGISLATTVVFLVVLALGNWNDVPLQENALTWQHVLAALAGVLEFKGYAGLQFALAAGMVGSMFSLLTSPRPSHELETVEQVRHQSSRKVILLRFAIGLTAATILYFFFESGLLTGLVFPELDKLGHVNVTPDKGFSSLVGETVPNAELSKLMIWGFLAGFSERLVSSMLRNVEKNDPAEKTAAASKKKPPTDGS